MATLFTSTQYILVPSKFQQIFLLTVRRRMKHIRHMHTLLLKQQQCRQLLCPIMPLHNPRFKHTVRGVHHLASFFSCPHRCACRHRQLAAVRMEHIRLYITEQLQEFPLSLVGERIIVLLNKMYRTVLQLQRVRLTMSNHMQLHQFAKLYGKQLHLRTDTTRCTVNRWYVM